MVRRHFDLLQTKLVPLHQPYQAAAQQSREHSLTFAVIPVLSSSHATVHHLAEALASESI
jgi:hypothetical protein